MYHPNTNKNRTGEAIFISDRADLTAREVIRNKEGHYIIT